MSAPEHQPLLNTSDSHVAVADDPGFMQRTMSYLSTSWARLGMDTIAIIALLGVYGYQQERIMAVPYNDTANVAAGGDFFRDSVFLVLCNRLVSMLFSVTMIASSKGESFKSDPPLWKYALVSVSNVAATYCQYEALKYVSFPVQVLGKSAKMVPVMLWGLAISGRRYGLPKWLVAFSVTGGCMMFVMAGSIHSKRHHVVDQHGLGMETLGLLLMLGFLACDGFTSTFQEKLFKDHNTTRFNQMLYVNMCSAVIAASILTATGGWATSIGFCSHHPRVIFDAFLLSVCATGGQVFIYGTIAEFGALVFAAIMNVRQIVSILLSLIIYRHPVTALQLVGCALVFVALLLGTAYESRARRLAASKDESLWDGKQASAKV